MNPNISCSSSIPTVSGNSATPYAYCIGKRGPPVYPMDCSVQDFADEIAKVLLFSPNFNITDLITEGLKSDAGGTSMCGLWTLEAINWATGASEFHVELGSSFQFNPFYAGTTIGPDGA